MNQGLACRVNHQINFFTAQAESWRVAQRIGAAVDHVDTVQAHVLFGRVGAIALVHGGVQFRTNQQAGALDLGDGAAEFILQRLEFGDHFSTTVGHVLAQFRRQ